MKESFITANSFPVKLLHNPVIQEGKIVPYHITLIPTNKCNGGCKECFCSNSDREKEMSFDTFANIIQEMYLLGTRAVSFSGGGEPGLHPDINDMIKWTKGTGIDVALVTNGKSFDKIKTNALNKLTWIRVSATTSKPLDLKKLYTAMVRGNNVDWGISYVVGSGDNYNHLEKVIEFANKTNLTHVRVVSDMNEPDINRLDEARKYIKTKALDESKVIWQDRNNNEHGAKNCLVSLLHPIIDVDGYIQPCCSYHFASNPPRYNFNKETAMTYWSKYRNFVKTGTPFDGSNCEICQYGNFNRVLESMLTKPKHEKFV